MSAQEGAGLPMATGTATGMEAPSAEPLNLYRFPALYDILKAPDAEDIAGVRALMQRFVGPAPWSILDPACGPGNWLRPFAAQASRLAGNDNCPEMVEYTQAATGATTTLGDMFELQFPEPFDVILEASGVTSLLPDVETLQRWVRSFRPLLAGRGAVILLLNFDTRLPSDLPCVLWRTPWRKVPGGKARIQYELISVEPGTRTQEIRRTVETRGGDWPATILETYGLRVWRPEDLRTLQGTPGFELVACMDTSRPDQLMAEPEAERLLVFKPA